MGTLLEVMSLPKILRLKLPHLVVVGACFCTLSACVANQPHVGSSIAAQTIRQVVTKAQNPILVTQAEINRVLRSSDKRVILVSIPKLQTQALFVEIERNGAIITYGSSTRQSISIENGVIRGTRGLGGDLMSTDHSLLRYTMKSGKPTGGTRILRYLDAASQTVTQNLSCSYHPGITVIETCVDSNGVEYFVNEFKVSNSIVVKSKQWVSAAIGYALVTQVR